MGKKFKKAVNQKIIVQLIFYCFIFILIYPALSNGSAKTLENKVQRLTQITTTLENKQINVTEWQFHMRENFKDGQNNNNKRLAKLKTELHDFTWETEKTNNGTKAGPQKEIGIRENELLGITEKIIFTDATTLGEQKSYLTYNVTGTTFKIDETQQILENIYLTVENIFQTNYEVFLNATGKYSGTEKITLQHLTDKMLACFNAKEVESLKEETFISLSAYTTLWNNSLKTNNDKMNLQIAVRDNEQSGDRTVTIGTPIITTEY